ncbi:MAG: ferritin-like domain-containing protein, partial [bacterium]
QKEAEEIARRMKSEEEAIELALNIEKDTLLFYYELIDGVEREEKEIVKRLIEQEKTHIRRLTTLRQIIKAG